MDSDADSRQPLLQQSSSQTQTTFDGTQIQPPKRKWTLLPKRQRSSSKPGPLELDRRHRWTILTGIWIANFLSSLNTTLVATLLSSISSEFNQANQASWLGTSYLLATCTFTPLYGRLCNIIGRRGANQTAVFFAGVGVLACGLSTTMSGLIAARFLSGMGGGGILTTASIITSDMFSLRDRGLTQGMASFFNSAGMGLGGPLGGFISDTLGWRWAFLLQIPVFVLSFMLTSANLNYAMPGRGKSTRDMLKRIDYLGFMTLFFSVGSLLLFLSFKYNEDRPWSNPSVIISLVISIVSAITFVVVELYISAEPIMAPFLFQKKDPVLISISYFLVSTCNFSVIYFFPMWFETVRLDNEAVAGLHLMPNSISATTGSLFAGWVMNKTGRYKTLMDICGIFPAVAGVLIAQMTENSGFVALWLSIIPLGFGNAAILQTTLIALLAAIPPSAVAIGTGFSQLFKGIGQVFGVALSSSIFQAFLDKELRARLPSKPDIEELILKIRQSTRVVGTLPPELQRPVRDAYAIGLRAVFITAACCTFMAYIVRLFITARSLDEEVEEETAIQQSPIPSETIPSQPQAQPQPKTVSPVDRRAGISLPVPSVSRDRSTSTPRRLSHRLSFYESEDGFDPESDDQAPARSFSVSCMSASVSIAEDHEE